MDIQIIILIIINKNIWLHTDEKKKVIANFVDELWKHDKEVIRLQFAQFYKT